jgi:8-oxo-dGTP diphosphatase
MRQGDGAFVPNDEVDQLMWLPPREAQAHLSDGRDKPVMKRFAEDVRPTRAVLLVRHASAGDREAWPHDDHDRPLDDLGREQAEAIADLLDAYQVTRVLSADVLRCLETVGPFATRRRVTVQSEPLLSESGFAAHPSATEERLIDILRGPETTAVCTQKALLPDALAAAIDRMGSRYDGPPMLRKGAMLAVHMTTDGDDEVQSVELLPSPRQTAKRS